VASISSPIGKDRLARKSDGRKSEEKTKKEKKKKEKIIKFFWGAFPKRRTLDCRFDIG